MKSHPELAKTLSASGKHKIVAASAAYHFLWDLDIPCNDYFVTTIQNQFGRTTLDDIQIAESQSWKKCSPHLIALETYKEEGGTNVIDDDPTTLPFIHSGCLAVEKVLCHVHGVSPVTNAVNTMTFRLTYDHLFRMHQQKDLARMGRRSQGLKPHTLRSLLLEKLMNQDTAELQHIVKRIASDVVGLISRGLEKGMLGSFPLLHENVGLRHHVLYMTETYSRTIPLHLPPTFTPRPWFKPYEKLNASVIEKSSACEALYASEPLCSQVVAILGKVPFTVNTFALQVQQEFSRQGYRGGDIPPAFAPCPSKNSSLTRAQRKLENQMAHDLKVQRDWYMLLLQEGGRLARSERFYLPHKLDFRGRVYPLPTVLTYVASGQYRSLFRFADSVPLGPKGLRWLKIHAANLYGHTKLSYDERENFMDRNHDALMDAVENPFGTSMDWWLKAESPFEFLVACEEIHKALKCSDPSMFLSSLPVQVDGTANGLQHYAALARDEQGAVAVNMTPCDRPQDVYGHVLKGVLELMEVEAAEGNVMALRALGTGVGQDKNHVKRSTIKRCVMTQVYGVTHYGMKVQLLDELERQNDTHNLWTFTETNELATYLRDKVNESLGKLFSNSNAIRSWMNEATMRIHQSQPSNRRAPLVWTTPLGLLVVQPYYRKDKLEMWDSDNGKIKFRTTSSTRCAHRKQITAFPPNFIHSLDATHMGLTVLELERRRQENAGQHLVMAAVHDSFWCHAANMDTLSDVLREQFVNLYQNYDPLGSLLSQWNQMYGKDLRAKGTALPQLPGQGQFDLHNVMNAPYFFS
eukprot:PhF_6_TR702/c0_g1_i1/m.1150/K10908/POLRMT, RPO41; DNA-directed RNA polymerase, mitochondrial